MSRRSMLIGAGIVALGVALTTIGTLLYILYAVLFWGWSSNNNQVIALVFISGIGCICLAISVGCLGSALYD